MVSAEERIKKFLEKEPSNNLGRIVRAFLKDYDVMGTPCYNLDEKGNAFGGLFIKTDHRRYVIKNVIKAAAPGAKFALVNGTFCTSMCEYHGFWVKLEE